MRFKIFFFPLALVVSLVVAVLLVQPEATKSFELFGEKQTLDQSAVDAAQQATHVAPLAQSLKQNASLEQSVLEQYFPKEKTNESFIDALNLLASQAGVSLTTIETKEDDAKVTPPTTTTLSAPTDTTNSAAANPNVSTETVPPVEIKTVSVNVDGMGQYPNIKDFLRKVSYTNHWNQIGKVSIEKEKQHVKDATGKDTSVAGSLHFGVSLTFSFLPEVKSFKNASTQPGKSAFASQTVDTSAVTRLNDFLTKGSAIVPKMVPVDNTGRNNPFIQ